MKVRKKPVIVEAYKLTEETSDMVSKWCNGLLIKNEHGPVIQIMTLEGVMTARNGDYVIKGIHDECYPCSAVVFEKIYEVIDE